MSASIHVLGIVPPDATFKKMLAAYTACKNAGVDLPLEILKFFNHETPDPAGVVIDLHKNEAVKDYTEEAGSGNEVDLDKLPKHIKKLRFVVSF